MIWQYLIIFCWRSPLWGCSPYLLRVSQIWSQILNRQKNTYWTDWLIGISFWNLLRARLDYLIKRCTISCIGQNLNEQNFKKQTSLLNKRCRIVPIEHFNTILRKFYLVFSLRASQSLSLKVLLLLLLLVSVVILCKY